MMPPSIDALAISLLLPSSSFRTREPIKTPSRMLNSLAGATTKYAPKNPGCYVKTRSRQL